MVAGGIMREREFLQKRAGRPRLDSSVEGPGRLETLPDSRRQAERGEGQDGSRWGES